MENSGQVKHETTWDWLSRWYGWFSNSRRQWIFRGQGDSKWDLQSTLERDILEFSPVKEDIPEGDCLEQRYTRMFNRTKVLSRGLPLVLSGRRTHGPDCRTVFDLEQGMLRKFQRQCYHYGVDLPSEERTMEWLALMRHYGAPSRLVDWTYSFFVAVFMAINEISIGEGKDQGECAVYFLDSGELDRQLKSRCFPNWWYFHNRPYVDHWDFVRLFGPDTTPSVYAVNPFRLNQRLTAQHGLFLVPTRVDMSFEENLDELLDFAELLSLSEEIPERLHQLFNRESTSVNQVFKLNIKVTRRQRNEIMRILLDMNLTASTLYGDLGGFAESMKSVFAFPDIYPPPQTGTKFRPRTGHCRPPARANV